LNSELGVRSSELGARDAELGTSETRSLNILLEIPSSKLRVPSSQIRVPSSSGPVDFEPVQAESFLKVCAAQVEARLEAILPSPNTMPTQLHEAMRYSSLAPGKRIRPALCIACAEAVGSINQAVIDAACAVEMVHAFSLIHDDLPAIDNDDLRRGRPTCHVRFGEAIAILAGDALFAFAFEVISKMSAPPEVVVHALTTLATASGSGGLVGGETLDVISEGKPVDQNTLEYIHSHKTGALMSASCEIGALVAGASSDQAESLKKFGHEVGFAFQIADDLLNELSTAEALGKAAGSDRARSKATYPALHGITESRSAAAEAIDRAFEHLDLIPNPDTLVSLARYSMERVH
jgi:geranylgeranyl diphosphate synthase type II